MGICWGCIGIMEKKMELTDLAHAVRVASWRASDKECDCSAASAKDVVVTPTRVAQGQVLHRTSVAPGCTQCYASGPSQRRTKSVSGIGNSGESRASLSRMSTWRGTWREMQGSEH